MEDAVAEMVVTPKHEEKGGSHEVAKSTDESSSYSSSVANSDKNVVDLESDENVESTKMNSKELEPVKDNFIRSKPRTAFRIKE